MKDKSYTLHNFFTFIPCVYVVFVDSYSLLLGNFLLIIT
jgi:hypothetical protein